MAPEQERSGTSLINKQSFHDKLVTFEKVGSANSTVSASITTMQVKLNHLQKDLSELIHLLHVTERASVKEIIQADIQQMLMEIESLEDMNTNQLETNVSWSRVAKLKHSKINYRRQQTSYSPHLTSNRYNLLSDIDGCEDDRSGNSVSERKQPVNIVKKKPKSTIRTKKTVPQRVHKVLLIGDSHTRGLAGEVKSRLNDEYEVIGNTNPGTAMEALKESATSKIRHLTKDDIVVMGGGAIDVAKNNSLAGMKQILGLSINASHTNVIQLSVPHRHDLTYECVNKEVRKFNIRLRNRLSRFNNITVIEAPDERDLYTRHGLHLNSKGKETMASKIALAIENVLQINTNLIRMFWTETNGTDTQEHIEQLHKNTSDNIINTSDHQVSGNITTRNPSVQEETPLTEHESARSSNRVWKNPTARYNDFLWAM